jgi:hypothetical protein
VDCCNAATGSADIPLSLCAEDGTKVCKSTHPGHVCSPGWLLAALNWPADVPFVSLASEGMTTAEYKIIMARFGIDMTGLEGGRCAGSWVAHVPLPSFSSVPCSRLAAPGTSPTPPCVLTVSALCRPGRKPQQGPQDQDPGDTALALALEGELPHTMACAASTAELLLQCTRLCIGC